jgi:hypothetical protein
MPKGRKQSTAMLRVEFNDFRCFNKTDWLEVRPITFLVGENSAGKTSFLAGLRFLLEAFSAQGSNPFNRDPYFLGGFEQIAHFRGGRGGRAKSFSLSQEGTVENTASVRAKRAETKSARHVFEFSKGYPQPLLTNYKFVFGEICIEVSLAADLPTVKISNGSSPSVALRPNDNIPAPLLRENYGMLPYLLHTTQLNLRKGDEDAAESLKAIGITDFDFLSLWQNFVRLGERSHEVFASAPVRTQPQRTYTPSELIASSEGSHVPLEFAQEKRRTPEEWKLTKAKLETFGRDAGLFSEIDIRNFGKSDIDPFQIQVKIGGPSTNLVDVGYGVSQALPLVYQLQSAARYRAFLLQQPEVHLHPRAQAEIGSLMVEVACSSRAPVVVAETHSDYIIDRVRIQIAAGRLSPDKATIIFFQRVGQHTVAENIYFNKGGEILDPPAGYRDFFVKEHMHLLGL